MATPNQIGEFNHSPSNHQLAPGQPEAFQPLLNHLAENIRAKTEALEQQGKPVNILGPDWCRENPEIAGQLHAGLIVKTYGDTYALPNKDPEANRVAIEQGDLDVYLLQVNREVVATACMVNTHDGRAELGRAASNGNAGGGIILDLRIRDWLSNPETAAKYHTLFTTLRSAPDRALEDGFVMRGGQAISAHWQKFPGLRVNGFGPLYRKHGALEQFSVASLTRNELDATRPLYIDNPEHAHVVHGWHDQYQLARPPINTAEAPSTPAPLLFDAHYPPVESGLTDLVHADIVTTPNDTGQELEACLKEVDDAGSPFAQVVVPVDQDTRQLQRYLQEQGFQVFGYQPADEATTPALLFGKVRPAVPVVPTFWSHEQHINPFWTSPQMHATAEKIAARWQ